MLKTSAIKNFLDARTLPDLANLYHEGMEVQVEVAQDGGERVERDYKGRRWHGFTDGVTTWKSFRIPYNAATEPSWDDSPMTWNLDEHANGIGLTGWDWKAGVSRWVGFDFDAIAGHSDSHAKKLTDAELKDVQKAACDLPWVSVRKSTSGRGLHLYVFLDDFVTHNHTEHSAVARSILGKMASLTGFNFQAKADAVGGVLWVWHRKMRGTDGLALIKASDVYCDVPLNWRDHINVVRGARKKTLPMKIEESTIVGIEQLFDDLTLQRTNIPLDEEHKKLIKYLEENNCVAWWDQDRHMLVTHTIHLKEAHTDLRLKGIFDTLSTGKDRGGDHNVYCHPMRKGAWAVRRFTPGVAEHASWTQDGSGWTMCYFNRQPDLDTAAKSLGGIEDPKGGFVFIHAEQAIQAASQVGVQINLPPWALTRRAKLKEHRDGRLVAEVDHDPNTDAMAGGMAGWLVSGKIWARVYHANLRPESEVEVGNYDDVLRHLITETGDDAGWTIRSEGEWVSEPLTHVKLALKGALGLTDKESTAIVGSSVLRNWRIVNRPFEPEYPGDRQWNRGAAQLRYMPTEAKENLDYKTWTRVLTHCGSGLDEAVASDAWCKNNGILTGGDYLKIWIASLFQHPRSPLPYLFFYSNEQNTGKSIFHESLSELIVNGYARAENALTNPSGFNGELANAVICVVEEIDLSTSKVAYNRMKDWVTSRHLPIHVKGMTPYTIPNTTKWIQTANDHKYCKVFPGDTRITMIRVPPLSPSELIPKDLLIDMLKREANDFMSEVLSLEIPNSNDRLAVPVVVTSEKVTAQQSNRTRLEEFIEDRCHLINGSMIKYSDFVDQFHSWLDPADVYEWTKHKIGRELPPHVPKGRRKVDGQFYLGNISWTITPHGPKLTLDNKGMLA